ncbi:MAG TPA: M20 family peptidase [Rhodothermales bacterium]|nr:M20 family peptidase [Rhodothermales bacterium]
MTAFADISIRSTAALVVLLFLRTLSVYAQQLPAGPPAPRAYLSSESTRRTFDVDQAEEDEPGDTEEHALDVLEPVLDAHTVAQHLSRAIQFPTVSHGGSAEVDSASFRAFHAYLTQLFPRVHTQLKREVVSGLSLLYTWPGRDSTLEPILLMSHQDVVPVDEGSASDWKYPPFSGVINNGYVWGRGTLDDKHGVLGILEATERLLQEGYVPERTIYLAFGHDEEVGGANGAAQIAGLLQSRGVRLALVVDEGGAIIKRFLSRIRGDVAAVGVAEKGSISLQLTVRSEGGHSSVPGRETAISIVSAAVTRLEKHPFPARLGGVTAQSLKQISPLLSLPQRFALSNLWLFRPFVLGALSRSPETDWMIRTTTAVTMISGGTKTNLLPTSASAVVNFRTMPGETLESVIDHVRRVVADERIEIRAVGMQREAPPPSTVDDAAFEVLTNAIQTISPDARVRIVPFLVPGGTDARYFRSICDHVYRFNGLRVSRRELRRYHATDERISVREYVRSIKFYYYVLRNASGHGGDVDQAVGAELR